MATAHGLTKRGVRDIAIIDERHLGFGASGRNAGEITSPSDSREWMALCVPFRWEDMFQNLSKEFHFNNLFAKRGMVHIIRDENDMKVEKKAIALQNSMGMKGRIIDAEELGNMIPAINTSGIIGGAFSPEPALARPEPVLWGYRGTSPNWESKSIPTRRLPRSKEERQTQNSW